MQRAYSILEVKSVQEDQRVFRGTATTPNPDRAGDIVEPLGVTFKNPLPLLFIHRQHEPVGTVIFSKPTAKGIEFEATIPRIDEPGRLKDRVDDAWQSVKSGLIRGVSIGFKPIKDAIESIKGGGIRYLKSEVLELSLVVVPANQDAIITVIRSLDQTALLAATGRSGVVRLYPPGASGQPTFRTPPKEGTDVKTYQEQIKDWEATRAAKAAAMETIMNKSADSGETPDAAQEDEYDGLKKEVERIDAHLVRLNDMAKVMATKAKPVDGTEPDAASRSRDNGRIEIMAPKLEKGIGFARYVKCVGAAKGNIMLAAELAKTYYPDYLPLQNVMKLAITQGGINLGFVRKAAVAAGSTSHADHHSALVNYQDLAGEFIDFLRPKTIIGQFGVGGVPSLRRVPFNIRVPRQTTKASGYWVGEGLPKPVTSFNTEQITLDFTKAATISVITEELARFSNPSAEALVRDELAAAVIERIDLDFIDPANAGTTAVKPASITNGATTAASTGDTAAAIRTDIQTLFGSFIGGNLPFSSAVFITNANVALALSMMMNELGQPLWPGITMTGGTFNGLPVIISQYVPDALLILVAADQIYLADDGNVSIDTSREASIEMLDSALQQNAMTGVGASMVSMFQTNSIAIRAEREINWRKRNDLAVAYLTSFNPGGTPGSGG